MILKDGKISDDEQEEEEEIQPSATSTHATPAASDTTESSLDLDDLSALDASRDGETGRSKYEPRVPVDADDEDGAHKGTVLRLISSDFGVSLSKDRLKRVRDSSQYDEPKLPASVNSALAQAEGRILAVEDPIVTLLRCDDLVFVAVVTINQIYYDNSPVQHIPASHAHEPNVRFRARIMTLLSTDSSHQPLESDWQWNHRFELGRDIQDLDGALVLLIDPETSEGVFPGANCTVTYSFRSEELRSMGALLFAKAKRTGNQHRIRTVKASRTFPYRLSNGMY